MSMSIRTFVCCDKCGASAESISNSTVRADIRSARTLARSEGWKLGKQRDLCKHCADELSQAVKTLLAAG